MKKLFLICTVMIAALSMAGCGLVSGTAFISQEVEGEIKTDTTPGGIRGGDGSLDATMTGVEVDLSENSDWQDFTIEGVEDGCIYVEANNHLTTVVSGEVWIVMDLDFDAANDPDNVRNHPDAFRVFSGIAIPADTDGIPGNDDVERVFTCQETINLLENTDRLVEAIQAGHFQAFGLGDQDEYCFTLTGLIFGFHVTGSI